MEVLLADHAGFCFGVKRAVDRVYEQIETGKKIYTFGPIIHNETVVKDLEERGVSVIESEDEIDSIKEGTVIIRSHGVPSRVCDRIMAAGLECVDATCPFVKRIHQIVQRESAAGRAIVIVGNAGHPEVEGIMGWSETPAIVIESEEQAQEFVKNNTKDVCVVSQTTFNHKKFKELVEILKRTSYDISVADTICNATEERQTEARQIAASVDAMIVIGGKHSSNTRKLYEICCEECEYTCLVQTLDDLHLELPESARLVGITAGASTPNKLIEEVLNYVRTNF